MSHIDEKNINTPKEKVLNTLREFFVHTSMIIKKNINEFSGVFEIISADFMLDDDLKLWFNGFQTNPSYIWGGDSAPRFYETIIKEAISIETTIRNERLAVIRQVMANIHEDISETQKNHFKRESLEPLKKDLKAKALSAKDLSHFELIFDDNLEGNLKTLNKLSSTCKIL